MPRLPALIAYSAFAVVLIAALLLTAAAPAPSASLDHDPAGDETPQAGSASTHTPGKARKYDRIPVELNGESFRARGYLNDDCLAQPLHPCLARSSGTFRPEATAQARAVQELDSRRGGAGALPAPADPSGEISGQVQWEFAPRPDSQHAPAYPTSDLDTTTDSRCSTDKWRIDILRDPNPPLLNGVEPVIGEVKRWEGTTDDVDTQLSCYQNRLEAAQPTEPRREPTLATWSQAYPDMDGDIWCVWGKQNPAGHVYFAPLAETPKDIASETAGCNEDTQERTRQRRTDMDEMVKHIPDDVPNNDDLEQELIVKAIAAEFTAQLARHHTVETINEIEQLANNASGCSASPTLEASPGGPSEPLAGPTDAADRTRPPEPGPDLALPANHGLPFKAPHGFVDCIETKTTDTANLISPPGETITATGYVFPGLEPAACDDSDAEVGDDTQRCDYEIVTAHSVVWAMRTRCHYNEGNALSASDATETEVFSGVTRLVGTVSAPREKEFVVCFRSDETFSGTAGGAPVAGTTGLPFLVLNAAY
jgi:hypothetical protein